MSYTTQKIEELIIERDTLRRALEIIAVGDAPNPQAQAAEELISLGFWRDIPPPHSINKYKKDLKMITKEELQAAVKVAEHSLAAAHQALAVFNELLENNTYTTLAEACKNLKQKLCDLAHEDCEGSGKYGNDTYTREFIVNGVKYVGLLTVEYNRHDKIYYYIDQAEFTYEVVNSL